MIAAVRDIRWYMDIAPSDMSFRPDLDPWTLAKVLRKLINEQVVSSVLIGIDRDGINVSAVPHDAPFAPIVVECALSIERGLTFVLAEVVREYVLTRSDLHESEADSDG